MEAALKNLASTVELLAVAARSSDVRLWDLQCLTRAFHWACYCEQLYSKFHQNPQIRELMEMQVHHANGNLRAIYGDYADLSFLDLSQCQHLLLSGLLKNPNLPLSIMKILFDATKPARCKAGEYQEVSGLCSSIIQRKSAIQILSPIAGQTGAGDEVQAALLTERLHALLSPGGETLRAQRFLDSVLEGCKEAERLCLVFADVVLTGEKIHAQSASVDFLLDWLQQKHCLLQHMCLTLPTSRLKDLAKGNARFRDMYYGILKKWTADMEYCLDDGKWVKSGTGPKVSFPGVVEHFHVLFEGCPTLARTVERELTDLKISDGDFDVRGISVWGDLLAEIHERRDSF
ncbi:Fanconi anemia group F protein [Stigmatopora argus]